MYFYHVLQYVLYSKYVKYRDQPECIASSQPEDKESL